MLDLSRHVHHHKRLSDKRQNIFMLQPKLKMSEIRRCSKKKNASIRSVYNLITSQSEPFCVVNIPRFLLLKITVVFLIVDKNV